MNRRISKGLLGVSLALWIAGLGCASGNGDRSAGQVVDDTAIHAKVKAALVNDPVISASQVDVDVHKGVVIFRGAVASPSVKQKVTDTAWGIEGVKGVQNDLVVRQ